MPAIRIATFTITMLILGTTAFGNDLSPKEILKKVAVTYKSMKTYKAEGILTTEIEDKIGGNKKKES